jgi:aspartate ammonia-lyase
VENSIGVITALGLRLGYEACSRIAGRALAENKRVYDLVLQKGLLSEAELNDLLQLEGMTSPSRAARSRVGVSGTESPAQQPPEVLPPVGRSTV